jgi:hypothetical protein
MGQVEGPPIGGEGEGPPIGGEGEAETRYRRAYEDRLNPFNGAK